MNFRCGNYIHKRNDSNETSVYPIVLLGTPLFRSRELGFLILFTEFHQTKKFQSKEVSHHGVIDNELIQQITNIKK